MFRAMNTHWACRSTQQHLQTIASNVQSKIKRIRKQQFMQNEWVIKFSLKTTVQSNNSFSCYIFGRRFIFISFFLTLAISFSFVWVWMRNRMKMSKLEKRKNKMTNKTIGNNNNKPLTMTTAQRIPLTTNFSEKCRRFTLKTYKIFKYIRA